MTCGVSGLTLAAFVTGGKPFGDLTETFLGRFTLDTNLSHPQINLVSTLWLIFLLPFSINRMLASLFAGQRPRRLWLVAVTLATPAAFISGQRSIYLAIIIGLGIGFVTWLSQHYRRITDLFRELPRVSSRILVSSSIVLACLSLILGWRLTGGDIAEFSSRIMNATLSDQVRTTEASALWSSFLESPILGHGSGYVLPSLQRNADFPWAYEILPLLILMTHGLIGSFFLFGAFLRMLRLLAASVNDFSIRLTTPMLAASVSTIVACGFNPVVTKLGTIWMALLPLLILQVRGVQVENDRLLVRETKR